MTTKTLITYNARLALAEQFYYSPIAQLELGGITVPMSTIYCFLAKVEPWEDEPSTPTQDQRAIKQVFKNMFVVKQITAGDIGLVIERIDWKEGTVYDYYSDVEDMFAVDGSGYLIKKFYIKNKYDQVFKCLGNSKGQASMYEPYFEPGTFSADKIYQGPDGYKWKYMYTIDSGLKVKFMDDAWIPVPNFGYAPNPLSSNAGYGDIEVINVTNGGSGYDPANSIISVVITGDGTGAAGTAQVEDGVITDIVMNNLGSNYTYVNAVITSATGAGAELFCPVSPVGGHGSDPASELGVRNVMLCCEFNGSESEMVPTDIDYHQLGLLISPTSVSSSPLPTNGKIYKTSTDLVVAPGFGLYVQDEWVYQGASLENSTFSARVLSFDAAGNVLKLINITGTLTTNAPVFGTTSATTRTLLNYSVPNFQIMSGYLAYIENRTGIQRSADGIEQFRLVLGH